jgi:hypothetical protein
VPVFVVNVREVRMAVPERRVIMLVGVRLDSVPPLAVFVLMV